MYSQVAARPLWALVAHCERETIDRWRLVHAPRESCADALALLAEVLVTKVRRERGGYVSVTVSIESNRYGVSDSGFFRLRYHGGLGYVIVEQDLSLG